VVVSFANPETVARYQQELNWPFPIFSDPARSIYRAFGMKRLSWFRIFSPATLALYLRLLKENRRPKRYGDADIYQGGGDFLINRQGEVLFAYRSRDPADRPSVAKLLEVIDATA
jgi:peroxiredoxin